MAQSDHGGLRLTQVPQLELISKSLTTAVSALSYDDMASSQIRSRSVRRLEQRVVSELDCEKLDKGKQLIGIKGKYVIIMKE